MSLAKILADYFLPSLDSLDTIKFHYFWKADAFLQNFMQSGHLYYRIYQDVTHLHINSDLLL